jgi:hypothetical protein
MPTTTTPTTSARCPYDPVTHHRRCPAERFPTLDAAKTAAVARRARAVLSGSPRHPVEAYPCPHCGGAHLRRAHRTKAVAA